MVFFYDLCFLSPIRKYTVFSEKTPPPTAEKKHAERFGKRSARCVKKVPMFFGGRAGWQYNGPRGHGWHAGPPTNHGRKNTTKRVLFFSSESRNFAVVMEQFHPNDNKKQE